LSLGYALRQKTISADIMREVAADFDLTKLQSPVAAGDPMPDFLIEEAARHTADWPEPPVPEARLRSTSKVGSYVSTPRENDPLTPIEAKAYMQRIIQLLRDGSRIPN
jgi:hypothetical protein